MEQQNSSVKYLPELMAEKDSIDPIYVHAVRLIKQEIDNITDPKPTEPYAKVTKKNLLDVTSGRSQKVECDILVPVERHPHVNFVGRLIGPAGSTMKGIQEMTNTRLAVLGKGSVRQKDREKAEELKDSDEKYAHLHYPLHVHVSALGPVPQAYVNLGRAVAEIQKLIIIDEATEAQYAQGMGRGMRGARGGGMRGRGGGGPGRGFQRGGRGGAIRGSAAGRGNSQGTRGASRGGARGRGAGRGQAQQFGQMQQAENYVEDYSYGGAAAATGFDQTGGYEGYDQSYDTSYGAEAGYGDMSYGEDLSYGQDSSFDAYGNGAAAAVKQASGYGGQSSFRGKMRGGARGRQTPY